MGKLTIAAMIAAFETIRQIALKYGIKPPDESKLISRCSICGKRGIYRDNVCPECEYEYFDE